MTQAAPSVREEQDKEVPKSNSVNVHFLKAMSSASLPGLWGYCCYCFSLLLKFYVQLCNRKVLLKQSSPLNHTSEYNVWPTFEW